MVQKSEQYTAQMRELAPDLLSTKKKTYDLPAHTVTVTEINSVDLTNAGGTYLGLNTVRYTTLHTHTHTHTHPFNGPFSGTTRVGQYQKDKTNLDFTEARDSEWQWHQLAICKSASRSRQITMPAPHHSVFYRPDALPATQPTASKH